MVSTENPYFSWRRPGSLRTRVAHAENNPKHRFLSRESKENLMFHGEEWAEYRPKNGSYDPLTIEQIG
jgi:hypothetical protein